MDRKITNLALFDFDGTITVADTFTPFIRYAVDPKRMAIGKVILAPLIVAYKFGLIHASPVRAAIVRFGFSGKPENEVRKLGEIYSREQLTKVIRTQALERIKWHKRRGDTVVLVSASLDVYLKNWCQNLDIDLICTEIEAQAGKITGRYVGRDCTGEEKAKRIREKYDLNKHPIIYAYGDTKDDIAMLSLATKKYYRWQEVTDADLAANSMNTARSDSDNAKRLKNIDQEDISLGRLIEEQG